jgi:hypothetical protein
VLSPDSACSVEPRAVGRGCLLVDACWVSMKEYNSAAAKRGRQASGTKK